MKSDVSQMLTLAKARIYRFEDDLRAHVLVEEIEDHFLASGSAPSEAAGLYRRYLAAKRRGEPVSAFTPKAAASASVDVAAELKRRRAYEAQAVVLPPLGRAVFIVGSPRSGTSFLFNLFAATGAFAYFTSLSHHRWPLFNLQRRGHRFIEHCSPDILEQNTKTLKLRADLALPAEGENILNRAIPAYDHVRGHVYRLKDPQIVDAAGLSECIARHLLYFRRSNFVCKSPFNSFRMRQLRMVYPDCWFIHITRNGYSTTRSIRENGFAYLRRYQDEVTPEESWALHVETVLEAAEELREHVMTVRFEDLVTEYPHALCGLLDSLHLGGEPPALNARQLAVHASCEARGAAHQQVDALNRRLGYT